MCVHSTVNIQCMGQGDVTEDKTASRASRQTPVQFPEPMEKPDAMLHTCNPTVLFWDERWRQETRAAAQEPAQQQKWPENKWETGTDYHLTNCSVCHTHHDMHMHAHACTPTCPHPVRTYIRACVHTFSKHCLSFHSSTPFLFCSSTEKVFSLFCLYLHNGRHIDQQSRIQSPW